MQHNQSLKSGDVQYRWRHNVIELEGREGRIWYFVWKNKYPGAVAPVCALIQRPTYEPEAMVLVGPELHSLQLAFFRTRAYARARSHEH